MLSYFTARERNFLFLFICIAAKQTTMAQEKSRDLCSLALSIVTGTNYVFSNVH